jgi:glycyl-tRNA synthetase
LQLAVTNLPIPANAEHILACREFITGRLHSFLLDKGFKYDVVAAVLAEQSSNPAGAYHAVQELTEWVKKPEWKTILPAYARCVRITRDQKELFPVKENLLKEKEEQNLYKDIQMMEVSMELPGSVEKFVKAFEPNIEEINLYFEKVLVMDDDPNIRSNRLGTLQRLANLGKGTADFSLLEGF